MQPHYWKARTCAATLLKRIKTISSRGARCSHTLEGIFGIVALVKEGKEDTHQREERCSCIIERIFGTSASSKDKRRTSRTHPNLVQALVICLFFITSTAHIRAVLIEPQPVSIKHSSRSSFASPFTSTTHHYELFWSMHS